MLRRVAVTSCVIAFVSSVVACGGGIGSIFGGGDNNNGNSDNSTGGNGFGNGNGSGGPGGGGTVGTVGGVTSGSACATSSAGTTRPPAYLVFMYDRSGSMNDKVGGGQTKWEACKTGLENFFSSASSSGIHASLTFFGQDSNGSNADCSAASYATPEVAMTPLPSMAFSAQIDATKPSTDTPTLAAIQGAIQYAQTIKPTDGGKVAVVLVTDGDPHNCNGNSVQAVASAAATVASTIPTYVVGIGSSLANMQAMAAGGGTTAILVNTTTPTQVTADLENALGSIAASQLGCQYGLPAPPAGQTLDVDAVNVDYTPSGAAQTTLAYSADCSDPNGWHYDSNQNPTQIIMCSSICDTLKKDQGGKVDIIFGCSTAAGDGGLPVK
jgi:hypothetical protein